MKRKAFFTFLFLLLFFIHSIPASFASEIPNPVGDIFVQDFAKVLKPEEAKELIELGKSVEKNTGAQVAVLTVESLEDDEIKNFSNEAFRKFKLGQKDKDDGVLLVVAMKEKKIRIEVGYGLEGILTDVKTGSLLDSFAIPALQEGKPNQAIKTTYKALVKEIDKNADVKTGEKKESLPAWQIAIIVIVIIAVVILDMLFFGGFLTYLILSIITNGKGGGGSSSGGGGDSGGGGSDRSW